MSTVRLVAKIAARVIPGYGRKQRIELTLQLAETRRRNGDLDGALASVNEAIAETGRKGALYGQCLDVLGSVHLDRGAPAEALEASRTALEIARSHHAPPEVIAERCYHLAAAENRCGNAQRQMELLQESISLYERAFSPQHVETANRLTDMGVALRNEGSFTEALLFLERACSAHQKILGLDAPEYVTDVEHLAFTQQALGKTEEAARLYDRLLRLKEKQLALDPVPYGRLLITAAEAYVAAGHDARAFETIQQGMRLLDRHREELAVVGERIVAVLEVVGRPADAEAFRKRIGLASGSPVSVQGTK